MTNKSKYTPGPWEAYAGTVIRAEKPSGMIWLATVPPCLQFDKAHGDMFDETRANARLIAAAPELLEALQTTLKEFRVALRILTEHPAILKEDMEPLSPGIGKLADAAIAKATQP